MLDSAIKEQLRTIFAALEANYTFDITVSPQHEKPHRTSGTPERCGILLRETLLPDQ